MTKKRVHEIAREHGVSSKDLLERLHAAGVPAKAASSVEEGTALKVLAENGPSSGNGSATGNGGPAPGAVKDVDGRSATPERGRVGRRRSGLGGERGRGRRERGRVTAGPDVIPGEPGGVPGER